MSTAELREKVWQKLESADDQLLHEILSIIELEACKNRILKIPEEHKKSVDIGLAQIDEGETLTNAEVQVKVKKWLGK